MRPTSKLIAGVLLALILPASGKATDISNTTPANAASSDKTATAIFAGGCFWCMEEAFDQVPGVLQTISGYTGGTKVDPTYEEVSSGTTSITTTPAAARRVCANSGANQHSARSEPQSVPRRDDRRLDAGLIDYATS